MYLPKLFAEHRPDALHELIARYPMATIVVATPDGLVANHVPLLLEPRRGPHGTLIGHVARANPLWQAKLEAQSTLAIFSGAHAYVSPSWYATKQQSGEVVPTWNYEVVHARGRLSFFEDRSRLRRLVEDLTDSQERQRLQRWRVSDAPADYIERMLGAIVGLEIELESIVGKLKASQNRSPEDRAGVVRGLTEAGFPAEDVRELVRAPAGGG